MGLIRKNVFSNEHIAKIYECVDKELSSREQIDWYDSKTGHEYPNDKKFIAIKKELLSRLDIDKFVLPYEIITVAKECADDICSEMNMKVTGITGITYVEYNPKYGDDGQPYLNPHKDHPGASDFVLDYQLDSNINWEIGINKDIYSLSNNDALGIITTKNYHWRAKRNWKEGEYVKMLFFHIALEDKNIKDCEYTIEEVWNFAEKYNGGK
jgi:hypothetical protein